MEIAIINTRIGNIEIKGDENGINSISLRNDMVITLHVSECLKDCVLQLQEYFKGELQNFNLIYNLQGTAFQKQVWAALQTIAYGETVCYQDIAERIGNPRAVQAVGTAIGKNPCLITIPCHRVINKNGKIGGFAAGVEAKRELLRGEEIDFKE